MKKLILAAALLALAACANLNNNPQLTADVSCRAIGASLEALAPLRASLPVSVVSRIQGVRERSEPLCTAASPPANIAAATSLGVMAAELITIEKGAK